MSSVSKSNPPVVYSGDVGVLLDESPQRLLSILIESAMGSLDALNTLACHHAPAKFSRLYAAGIKSIGTWNSEVIREEVSKLTSKYPECADLFKYSYLRLLSFLRPDLTQFHVPTFDEFYHSYMRRVSEADDVGRGKVFFELPFAHKRVVFVECFRNSLHDTARRHSLRSPLENRQEFADRKQRVVDLTRRSSTESCEAADKASERSSLSRRTKENAGAAGAKTSLLTQATLKARERLVDNEGLQHHSATVKAGGNESDKPCAREAPQSEIVPPSSVGNGSKNIELKNEPCFYSPLNEADGVGQRHEERCPSGAPGS